MISFCLLFTFQVFVTWFSIWPNIDIFSFGWISINMVRPLLFSWLLCWLCDRCVGFWTFFSRSTFRQPSSYHMITYISISGSLLRVDPRERPTISDVVSQLQQVAVARSVNLKAALELQPTSKDVLQRELSFTRLCQVIYLYKLGFKFF